MNILILGASGMIGQGILRQSILAQDVEKVIVVVRSQQQQEHPKLQQLILEDLSNLTQYEHLMQNIDACFFVLVCLRLE